MTLVWRALSWTVLGVAGLGVSLSGCQSIDEATGTAKIVPDEFAVVTKAPLIVPPDFNLRPPRPGSPEANAQSPEDEARQTLYQSPAQAADALGPSYSDGEKILLAKSGGAVVDPDIRRTLSNETGYETDKSVTGQLVGNAAPAPGQATTAATATPPAKTGGDSGYENDKAVTDQLLNGAGAPPATRGSTAN
jgi:hypothetical protein